MNEDLEQILDRAERNNPIFHNRKFDELMIYMQPTDKVQFEYKTNYSSSLNRTTGVKYLGVRISDDGSFLEQIRKSFLKGKKRAGWICRIFNIRNMLILYEVIVLPLLEYFCSLWCPTIPKIGFIPKEFY